MIAAGRNDNGFTFVEVLISMAVLSIIMIPLFSLISGSIEFTGKLKEKSRINSEILVIDQLLRKETAQIKFPLWIDPESCINLQAGNGSVGIPYRDGNRNLLLNISNGSGSFSVTTPDFTHTFKNWEIIETGILHNSCGAPVGIKIVIVNTEKKELKYPFPCIFGSRGYGMFKEDLN